MSPFPVPSVLWTAVYVGLAIFFVAGARKFDRPAYVFVGVTMVLLAIGSAGMWILGAAEGPDSAILGGRLVVLAAAFAPACNTHFLFRYSGRFGSKLPYLGYVFAGGGWLADMVTSLRLGPVEVDDPVPLLAAFFAVVFVAHLVADIVLLSMALVAGRNYVLVPLVALVLLGPAVAFGLAGLLVLGSQMLLPEVIIWAYGLALMWALLAELRSAEGLLQQTSSSLAERTKELQVSYAEIELMHDELTKKQQLAAVGELAAAIAHEVRNPLAIIVNASSGLRRPRLAENDRETLLSIVDEEAERLNHLVSELLRFARPVEAARGPASLLDICQRLQSAAPEGFEVRVNTPPEETLGAVWVDPGLFRLALDNLMANAQQAMPNGGVITISVERDRFDDGVPAAAVSVRDTGAGMTAEELEKARKPFFTTRPRGTGLGLPIVERIVDAHGGELSLESEQGTGTTVTLRVPFEDDESLLPSTGEFAPAPITPSRAGTGVPSGSRTPSSRRSYRSVPPSPSGAEVSRESSNSSAGVASRRRRRSSGPAQPPK